MCTRGWVAAIFAVAFSVGVAHADKKQKKVEPPPPPEPVAEEAEPPAEDEGDALPDLPHVEGPRTVDLGHGAEIALPAGLVLYEATAAQQLMHEWGNDPEGTVAIILRADAKWAIVLEVSDMGYISDGDADQLDADELLASFREGATRQNKERVSRGIPELILDGWSQRPQYERAAHRLVWGLDAHDVNGKVINFDTRLLGRNGYLAFGLIDTPEHIAAARQETQPVLDAIRWKQGFRYEDHADGDHDSGIGLRGLVLGGAGIAVAKKTGLLVVLLAFFKKAFIFIAAGLAAAFRWLFRRKREEPAPVVTAPPDDTSASDPPANT
jgi:uncharacterized membrane-anchored protein